VEMALAVAPVPAISLRGSLPQPGQKTPPVAQTTWNDTSTGVMAMAAAGLGALGASSTRRARNSTGKVPRRQQLRPTMPMPTTEMSYYSLNSSDADRILGLARRAISSASGIVSGNGTGKEKLMALLCDQPMQSFLISISRLPLFSQDVGNAFKQEVDNDLLSALKQLKNFWYLPQDRLASLLQQLAKQLEGEAEASAYSNFQRELESTSEHGEAVKDLRWNLPEEVQTIYMELCPSWRVQHVVSVLGCSLPSKLASDMDQQTRTLVERSLELISMS